MLEWIVENPAKAIICASTAIQVVTLIWFAWNVHCFAVVRRRGMSQIVRGVIVSDVDDLLSPAGLGYYAPDRCGADTPSGKYGGLREDDLSIHLGVEMTFNGAKEAWPADSMSSLDFGSLVADWIVDSGRQDLTLEEVCESIKRGDHKGADL